MAQHGPTDDHSLRRIEPGIVIPCPALQICVEGEGRENAHYLHYLHYLYNRSSAIEDVPSLQAGPRKCNREGRIASGIEGLYGISSSWAQAAIGHFRTLGLLRGFTVVVHPWPHFGHGAFWSSFPKAVNVQSG